MSTSQNGTDAQNGESRPTPDRLIDVLHQRAETLQWIASDLVAGAEKLDEYVRTPAAVVGQPPLDARVIDVVGGNLVLNGAGAQTTSTLHALLVGRTVRITCPRHADGQGRILGFAYDPAYMEDVLVIRERGAHGESGDVAAVPLSRVSSIEVTA